ncbi:hypothetical protein F383_34074 [Gossypium arboreum]|uniref:Uncharacterized protein n=1 Tax=Gossypium arboreum TaxID=29729 RepID=A0A0B0MWC9_GOSAR|nr:hypothetical protein F383_29429 [Gossypium arboreum]KHG04991.1 hypothetical protein F383_31103 [Gossypium arboreum]KHG07283.1 hypothetical protein F383_34074 [Gossypium arboreum]
MKPKYCNACIYNLVKSFDLDLG